MPRIDLLPEESAGPLINETLVRLGSEPGSAAHMKRTLAHSPVALQALLELNEPPMTPLPLDDEQGGRYAEQRGPVHPSTLRPVDGRGLRGVRPYLLVGQRQAGGTRYPLSRDLRSPPRAGA